jgi:hypothetical protein
MALTKCHECGQDVSTQAKACPPLYRPVYDVDIVDVDDVDAADRSTK